MIIHHINRFFSKNSKWVFGIFTVVIIISFLDFFSPQGGLSALFGARTKQDFGSVYGQDVSMTQMQDAYRQIGLVSLLYGRNGNPDNEEVFRFIALGAAMDKQGITVSDEELITAIRQVFAGSDGKYSQASFDNFLTQVKRQGFTGKDIDEAVRRLMAEEKLRKQWQDSIVVTDSEIELMYKTYNQKLNTRVKLFPATPAKGEFSNEELQEVFSNGNYVKLASTKALIVEFSSAEKAWDFATAVYNEVTINPALGQGVFENTAKNLKLSVKTIPAFNESATKAGDYESKELVAKLFDSETPVVEYTIKGEEKDGKKAADKFLVGMAFDMSPARPYQFEEVKGQVVAAAQSLAGRRNALLAADAEAKKLLALSVEDRLKTVKADGKFNPPIELAMSDSSFGVNTGIGDVSISASAVGNEATPSGFAVRIVESVTPADMAKLADSKEFIKQLCLMQKTQLRQMGFWREVSENCRMVQSEK